MNLFVDKASRRMTARLTLSLRCWALAVAGAACSCSGGERIGADTPWTTYEAEAMKTNGVVLGPKYAAHLLETESSGQKCVRLMDVGGFVEFAAEADANALVVRFSLPDSKDGGGVDSSLTLFINGKEARTLALTSHYSRIYGAYPFSNTPADGIPRNFYDEIRIKDLPIAKSDVIRLQKNTADGYYCIIDLVDLENVPASLAAPANALSVLDFGAGGKGVTDDTAALRQCVAAAQQQGRVIWVPAGDYRLTGEILVPSAVTIQGAGMWHTTFVGDDTLYSQADRRVRFKLKGRDIHLADFAVRGKLNYRNDNEPNDGVVGAGCADSSVARLWIEHTKVGVWIYNGTQLLIEGCRFRNTIADGVNLCVGARGCVIQNCSARGTGDDCFAIWPAASDQGFVGQGPPPGNNVIRRCTGQLTFLANGAAIYGGAANRLEDCLFTDISTGCGILLSTTFPTSDEALKIDNNFSGTTVVRNCELVRCGGDDHSWSWRAALQLCVDRKSISGILLSHINIRDSISDGLSVVAPGSPKVGATLSDVRLEQVNIPNWGIGAPNRHALWIREDAVGSLTLVDSKIASLQNDSTHFSIRSE
jgi:hypothetical protein